MAKKNFSSEEWQRKMRDDTPRARTLEWFVFRARCVETHSLLTNGDLPVPHWMAGGLSLRPDADGSISLHAELPPEEAFESPAARCRPFMMESDDLYLEKVLAALEVELQSSSGHPDLKYAEVFSNARSQWKQHNPKSGATLGFSMQRGSVDGALGAMIPDTKLADAWLYCDFGHGDTDVTERVGDHDLDDRYLAASYLVMNLARIVVLLQIMRKWHASGLVAVRSDAFDDRVLARPNRMIGTGGKIYTAPVGTDPDAFLARIDALATTTDQKAADAKP